MIPRSSYNRLRVNFTKEDGALFKGIQVIILVGVSIREL